MKRSKVVLRKVPPPPPGPVPGDPFTFQIGTLNILGSQHRGNGTGRAAALAGADHGPRRRPGRPAGGPGRPARRDERPALRLLGLARPGARQPGRPAADRLPRRDCSSWSTPARSPPPSTSSSDRSRGCCCASARPAASSTSSTSTTRPATSSATATPPRPTEIALVQQLRATGKPVLLMGDTNEHTESACRIAGAAGMVGSNGLSNAGGCSAGTGPIKIDHILGGGGSTSPATSSTTARRSPPPPTTPSCTPRSP